eukprot:scaffold61806_cov67-Phaeocystis_antarctica.AAC.8
MIWVWVRVGVRRVKVGVRVGGAALDLLCRRLVPPPHEQRAVIHVLDQHHCRVTVLAAPAIAREGQVDLVRADLELRSRRPVRGVRRPRGPIACVEDRASQDSGQLVGLHRLLLAPDHTSGCPTLRPASADQPLGRLWPATSAAPRPGDWVATDEDGVARVTHTISFRHGPHDAAGRLRHALGTRGDGHAKRLQRHGAHHHVPLHDAQVERHQQRRARRQLRVEAACLVRVRVMVRVRVRVGVRVRVRASKRRAFSKRQRKAGKADAVVGASSECTWFHSPPCVLLGPESLVRP